MDQKSLNYFPVFYHAIRVIILELVSNELNDLKNIFSKKSQIPKSYFEVKIIVISTYKEHEFSKNDVPQN